MNLSTVELIILILFGLFVLWLLGGFFLWLVTSKIFWGVLLVSLVFYLLLQKGRLG